MLEMLFIFIWMVITCTHTTYFKLYISDLCTLHVTPPKFSFISLVNFGCAKSLLLEGFSLVAASEGYSRVSVCGLLTVAAPLVLNCGLQGTWAQ